MTFAKNYTFDKYMECKENSEALAIAREVAEGSEIKYNPICIYGHAGVGKTTMVHCIGNYIAEHMPEKKVIYTMGSEFVDELIKAMQQGISMVDFRAKYKEADLLIIDDIHVVAGKEATQDALLSIFKYFIESGKQIIVTTNVPIWRLFTIDYNHNLQSQIEGGLTLMIKTPCMETRKEYLQMKSKERGMDVPEEVIHYIAQNEESNMRELDGALNILMASSTINKSDISLDMAKESLSFIFDRPKQQEITCEQLIDAMQKYYGISLQSILSKISPRHNDYEMTPTKLVLH